jgi:L-lysine exporter family protein LysE/ArgO
MSQPWLLALAQGFGLGASLIIAIGAQLGFSLLNPHAFLDTVILIGSVGAHYTASTRIFFALGTMLASFVWFFSLAYGAGKLAPLFRHPRAWQILDIAVSCLMWIIAGTLILSAL